MGSYGERRGARRNNEKRQEGERREADKCKNIIDETLKLWRARRRKRRTRVLHDVVQGSAPVRTCERPFKGDQLVQDNSNCPYINLGSGTETRIDTEKTKGEEKAHMSRRNVSGERYGLIRKRRDDDKRQ
jgi:hypothetical protein